VSALIIGTVLALAALGFVLYPLFREGGPTVRKPARPVREAREPSASERAVAILREVEFDRETGKLSESDYKALKNTYTREALAAMRSEDSAVATAAGVPDDEIEAVILKYRARPTTCESCGPRPEPDAIYCSSCGRYLAGVCGGCGAKITEVGARFCPACGESLAA
jgi:translation initiation factor 2 beta subunit (eIF-2beta)/eIF-5